MTVGAALAAASERISRAASPSAHTDARRLLEQILARDGAWLLAHHDSEIEDAALRSFEAAVARREHGEPIAYIIGEATFYGRRFLVNANVLTPRPETEELVEHALTFLRARGPSAEPVRVLDIGTGSGAIAITLAAEIANVRVDAIDVSEEALDVARRNARALGVGERVGFTRDATFGVLTNSSDTRIGASANGNATAKTNYTCIVANLPYVERSQLRAAPDPTSFEPRLALDGGDDGLDVYRAMLDVAPRLLARDGGCFLEAGPANIAALAELARNAFASDPSHIAAHDDYAGLGRIVEIRRNDQR